MNFMANLMAKASNFTGRKTVMRWAAPVLLLSLVFCAGFCLGSRQPAPVTFHDMIVNKFEVMSSLIDPDDRRIESLAAELKTPEQAYLFVLDRIAFDPSLPAVSGGQTLAEGRGSCLGKAVLLCTLYRAMGMKPTAVRVVTGEVDAIGGVVDHAWVELEHGGNCLQQDATDLLGRFS